MSRFLILLTVCFAALVAIAADAPPQHTAGPGTPPSTMALVNQVRVYEVENIALKAENAALKLRVTALEDRLLEMVRIQQRDNGLRTPAKFP